MKRVLRCLFSIVVFSTVLATAEGQEWERIVPVFERPGVYDMSLGVFVDENNGWFTENFPGRIWRTTDGGHYWLMQKDSSNIGCSDICFTDEIHGWIVGGRIGDYQHLLWRTTDGGNFWQEMMLQNGFFTVNFIDSLNGFAADGYTIYKSKDGGLTWEEKNIEPIVYLGAYDIFFINGQFGWAVGISVTPWDAGTILNTIDGGETWLVNLHPTYVGMGVYFTDRIHGVVVGSNPPGVGGIVMNTEDGGMNWEEQLLPCGWLRDVAFTNDSTGWIVGDYGFIWKTLDSGKTWFQVESGTESDLYNIVFVDEGRVGYIFGQKGTLLRYESYQNVVVDNLNRTVPNDFILYINYPNPFNGETNIEYELLRTSSVYLSVYDIRGKEVVRLHDRICATGRRRVVWNGKDETGREVCTGVYVLKLATGSHMKTGKLIFIR